MKNKDVVAFFIERLRLARLEKRMTQKEVADMLGTDRSTISYYESGKSLPPIPTLCRIAEILDKPVSYFFE